MMSKVLSLLLPMFLAFPVAVAWGQAYDEPWEHAGMFEGSPNVLPAAGCGIHDQCHLSCGSSRESCCEIAYQLVGDVKHVLHSFLRCHACCSFCLGASGPSSSCIDPSSGDFNAYDGGAENPEGAGGIEIVPRPWPPGYHEVPPPQTDPLSIMNRQRDAYARRVAREAKVWIAANEPLAPEPAPLIEPRRIMAVATDADP